MCAETAQLSVTLWDGIAAFPGGSVRKLSGPTFANPNCVIWFYERKGEHLRCEIQEQVQGDKFALVVTMPDGTERVELFHDSASLSKRSAELEKRLNQEGWNGPFGRDL